MEEISTNQRCPNLSGILQTAKSGEETDKKAQQLYEKDIIKEIKQNPNRLWQHVQAKMKTRTGIATAVT